MKVECARLATTLTSTLPHDGDAAGEDVMRRVADARQKFMYLFFDLVRAVAYHVHYIEQVARALHRTRALHRRSPTLITGMHSNDPTVDVEPRILSRKKKTRIDFQKFKEPSPTDDKNRAPASLFQTLRITYSRTLPNRIPTGFTHPFLNDIQTYVTVSPVSLIAAACHVEHSVWIRSVLLCVSCCCRRVNDHVRPTHCGNSSRCPTGFR